MDDFPRPILAAIETEASAVRAGLVMASPESRALAERVLAFARASSGALEVDVQGALGALLAQSVAHASVMEHLVDVWIARGGAAFAVRAAIAQRKLVASHPRDARKPGGFDRSVRWLEPRKRAQLVTVLDVPTWEALRSAAKRTKRDERTALAVSTSELRAELALPLRVWLDGIVPDARAAIEDVEALATADEADARDAIPWCPPLFAALALEPGELTKRAGATLLERSSRDVTATARLPEYARDSATLLGADAAPALVALLSAAHAARTLDPRAQKKLAEALLEIDLPAVAQFFGTMVESKVLRTIAAEYMKKHAARAVSVLGTGRATSNVLREIAHSHPEEVREGLAELDVPEDDAGVAARKLVEKALKQTAGGREANDDELPWVLREPPWRRSKARPAPLTMTWGERFADYELVQPFPQLGRATFTPTPDERVKQSVTRFRGASAPFMAICGRLESRGWRRLDPVEGAVRGYYKRFGEPMAVYEFSEPIVFGEPMPEATTIGVIRFREPLERIGAIAFSEAAYDLHVFTNHESA